VTGIGGAGAVQTDQLQSTTDIDVGQRVLP
jgi:hypothetical protein